MLGYCSNSPLRCQNAMSMIVLSQTNDACPECGLSLIPAPHLSNNLRIDFQIIQLALLVLVLILLALVYIYYTIFV